MIGIAEIKNFHHAYRCALEVHRQWDDTDEPQLLALFEHFLSLVEPLLVIAGTDWHRSQELHRHLTATKYYLKRIDKGSSWSDICDLIYADLPALGDQLFRMVEANKAP